MTKKQETLMKKHGTPEQFAEAVWKACCDLMVTIEEARVGVAKYEAEWKMAGKKERKAC